MTEKWIFLFKFFEFFSFHVLYYWSGSLLPGLEPYFPCTQFISLGFTVPITCRLESFHTLYLFAFYVVILKLKDKILYSFHNGRISNVAAARNTVTQCKGHFKKEEYRYRIHRVVNANVHSTKELYIIEVGAVIMQYHIFGKKGTLLQMHVLLCKFNLSYWTCILVQVKHKHFSLNVIFVL